MAPFFERRLPLASVPRRQINLRQVQNIHGGMNCMRVMTAIALLAGAQRLDRGRHNGRGPAKPSEMAYQSRKKDHARENFLRQHRQLRQHFVSSGQAQANSSIFRSRDIATSPPSPK
jgi:hypothetical protein